MFHRQREKGGNGGGDRLPWELEIVVVRHWKSPENTNE